MRNDNEYKVIYEEIIKGKLPASFIAMYEKNGWLHDWYLKNLYISNTGTKILVYSDKGSSTLQIEFCTSNNDKNILIVYKNVKHLKMNFSETSDVASRSPTGFGRCLQNQFSIFEDSTIQHEYYFEGGNTILVNCETISFKRIINNFW